MGNWGPYTGGRSDCTAVDRRIHDLRRLPHRSTPGHEARPTPTGTTSTRLPDVSDGGLAVAGYPVTTLPNQPASSSASRTNPRRHPIVSVPGSITVDLRVTVRDRLWGRPIGGPDLGPSPTRPSSSRSDTRRHDSRARSYAGTAQLLPGLVYDPTRDEISGKSRPVIARSAFPPPGPIRSPGRSSGRRTRTATPPAGARACVRVGRGERNVRRASAPLRLQQRLGSREAGQRSAATPGPSAGATGVSSLRHPSRLVAGCCGRRRGAPGTGRIPTRGVSTGDDPPERVSTPDGAPTFPRGGTEQRLTGSGPDRRARVSVTLSAGRTSRSALVRRSSSGDPVRPAERTLGDRPPPAVRPEGTRDTARQGRRDPWSARRRPSTPTSVSRAWRRNLLPCDVQDHPLRVTRLARERPGVTPPAPPQVSGTFPPTSLPPEPWGEPGRRVHDARHHPSQQRRRAPVCRDVVSSGGAVAPGGHVAVRSVTPRTVPPDTAAPIGRRRDPVTVSTGLTEGRAVRYPPCSTGARTESRERPVECRSDLVRRLRVDRSPDPPSGGSDAVRRSAARRRTPTESGRVTSSGWTGRATEA